MSSNWISKLNGFVEFTESITAVLVSSCLFVQTQLASISNVFNNSKIHKRADYRFIRSSISGGHRSFFIAALCTAMALKSWCELCCQHTPSWHQVCFLKRSTSSRLHLLFDVIQSHFKSQPVPCFTINNGPSLVFRAKGSTSKMSFSFPPPSIYTSLLLEYLLNELLCSCLIRFTRWMV